MKIKGLVSLFCVLFFVTDIYALDFNKKIYPTGLTLVHVERKSIPAIAVSMIIKASPLQEPSEKAGLAYITAKMLNEGTKKMNAKELSENIEFLGASMAASVNHDYTLLSMTFLRQDIDKMMSLFSEVLLQPAFEEKDLLRKKEQTKGLLRQREEEPSFLSEREFRGLVFGTHPYGRPVEGSQESIDRITTQDLNLFYQGFYFPSNAILSVVGDISFKELDAIVNKYLSGWENKDTRKADTWHYKKEVIRHTNEISFIDRDITQANIIFGHIGIERSNPDFYPLSVMNYILGGGGFASRLMKVVRDDMGLTYGISSHFSTNLLKGIFEVQVQTKNEAASQVVGEIKKQIQNMQKEPVSEQELKDAKSFLIGSFPRRLETNRKIADLLAVAQYYQLGDDYFIRYPDYINAVTRDDIQRVAKKYLSTDKYTLVITGKKDKIKLEAIR